MDGNTPAGRGSEYSPSSRDPGSPQLGHIRDGDQAQRDGTSALSKFCFGRRNVLGLHEQLRAVPTLVSALPPDPGLSAGEWGCGDAGVTSETVPAGAHDPSVTTKPGQVQVAAAPGMVLKPQPDSEQTTTSASPSAVSMFTIPPNMEGMCGEMNSVTKSYIKYSKST